MEGARLRYKKCWESCHAALQRELSRRTIESDPGDARVLTLMIENEDLDLGLLVDAAFAVVPRGDPVKRRTLEGQVERLKDLAGKVMGFTWEDIREERSTKLPDEFPQAPGG